MDIGFKRGGLLAAIACLAAVAPCAAEAADADFKFARRPTGADFEAYYPSAALGMKHGGAAQIHCRIGASGELEKCVVLAEAPAGEGFDAAALKIASKWRMTQATVAKHQGEVFETTIKFNWDNALAPELLFLPGDAATLVTLVTGAPRGPGQVFDCPTPSGVARRCQSHPVKWATHLRSDDSVAALAGADLVAGKTVVECAPGKDGALTDCRLSGDLTPKTGAAALAFTKTLKAPAKALDRTPVASGKLIFVLDWAAIQTLRERLAEANK